MLQVDQHAKLDFTLEVGAINQEIAVTAAEPLLDAVEASMGQVIENRQITEMPLNGRNYVSLGLLSEGTADAAAGARYSGFSCRRAALGCQQLSAGRRGQQQL